MKEHQSKFGYNRVRTYFLVFVNAIFCVVEMERDALVEQRINIKFLVKLGKSGHEIIEMLETVYGKSTMGRRTIYKWVNRFKEGRESVDDDMREGRPSTSRVEENIQRVHDLVMSERRITNRMIATELGISKGSAQIIVKENLNMRKLCAKIVPKVLTQEQKQQRVACCQNWMKNEESLNFLPRVITGDESWIYEYDPGPIKQSEDWKQVGEPRSKKACKSHSKVKIMLIVFFDIHGVIYHEFVPQGGTVNAAFYVEVLKRLRKRVQCVRSEMWAKKNWVLHHDNASSHSALVREFFVKNDITTMDHPPNSPDLAPYDFFLFPQVKRIMQGEHFGNVDSIKHKTTRLLKGLTSKDMQNCFLQWKNRWARCIQSGGEYIEDHVSVSEYVYTNLEYHSREHHEEIQSEHKCSNSDNNMELDRSVEESRRPEIITSQCIIKEEIDIVDEPISCTSWD